MKSIMEKPNDLSDSDFKVICESLERKLGLSNNYAIGYSDVSDILFVCDYPNNYRIYRDGKVEKLSVNEDDRLIAELILDGED